MIETIAVFGGLDSSGGAGLAADLRMAASIRVRALPIATCLAIQNDQNFVKLKPFSQEDICAQFNAVKESNVKAVKIGALGSLEAWPEVLQAIQALDAKIIVDPVFKTSSGGMLVGSAKEDEIIRFYKSFVIPKATLVTPNYDEAKALLGETQNLAQEELALKTANELKTNVLLKGGHGPDAHKAMVKDILCYKGNTKAFQSLRIDKNNVRGTGCALATALAGLMAKEKVINDFNIELVVKSALNTITKSFKAAPRVHTNAWHLYP